MSNITITGVPQNWTKNIGGFEISFDKFFGQYDLYRDGMDWIFNNEVMPTKSDIQSIKQSKIDYDNGDFISLDKLNLIGNMK